MCSRLAIFFKLFVEVAIDPYCLLAGIPQCSETVEQEESRSSLLRTFPKKIPQANSEERLSGIRLILPSAEVEIARVKNPLR